MVAELREAKGTWPTIYNTLTITINKESKLSSLSGLEQNHKTKESKASFPLSPSASERHRHSAPPSLANASSNVFDSFSAIFHTSWMGLL